MGGRGEGVDGKGELCEKEGGRWGCSEREGRGWERKRGGYEVQGGDGRIEEMGRRKRNEG
jgi:hypothetical protein